MDPRQEVSDKKLTWTELEVQTLFATPDDFPQSQKVQETFATAGLGPDFSQLGLKEQPDYTGAIVFGALTASLMAMVWWVTQVNRRLRQLEQRGPAE